MMFYRFLDVSFMICLSFSLLFVGVENTSELPPPRNLNFTWETPFTISLTWEKPDNLAADCIVNYTINVFASEVCPKNVSNYIISRKVSKNNRKLDVSNENGLCISVTTNPHNCTNRNTSQPRTIVIPAPPVKLVTPRTPSYSKNIMTLHWTSAVDVKDLKVFYWYPNNDSESLKPCLQNEMQVNTCFMNNIRPWGMSDKIFYLFSGIYEGRRVSNTFMGEIPKQNVLLNTPKLTIKRNGPELRFQASASDLDEFPTDCYKYKYTYRHCNQESNKVVKTNYLDLNYDPSCKYTASVQVIFSDDCGKGGSEPSEKEEYGENKDLKLPALLAIILIPLIVSCCLIVSLVLLRRNRDIIFPNIPDPSLMFKDMLNNNIRTTDGLRTASNNRLYVPIEEIVESKISLEPDALTD